MLHGEDQYHLSRQSRRVKQKSLGVSPYITRPEDTPGVVTEKRAPLALSAARACPTVFRNYFMHSTLLIGESPSRHQKRDVPVGTCWKAHL